jgi:hypothetical protein
MAEKFDGIVNSDNAILLEEKNGVSSFYVIGEDGSTLQFHSVATDASVQKNGRGNIFQALNTWNRNEPSSRSYKDGNDFLHLAMDLVLQGGISESKISEFIDNCSAIEDKWEKVFLN